MLQRKVGYGESLRTYYLPCLRLARTLCVVGLLALVVVGMGMPGSARAAEDQSSRAVSNGFRAKNDSGLVAGALVSTSADDASQVELATAQSASRLAGVVSSSALIKLGGDKAYTAQVVSGGVTTALVSDINGGIKAGDKITVSPINGVGMVASSDSQVVGTALDNFDTTQARTQKITDANGKQQTVHIAALQVQINIAYYVAPASQFIPPFLRDIARNMAGRPVSALRIILGLAALVFAFVSISVLIYASVRGGMLSLGRNPLAAKAIHREMAGSGVIAGVILLITFAVVYIIITY